MIITLCGGGSTFTPGIVKSIALRKDELDVDEIRLYDINEERQRKIGVLVDWILHEDLGLDIKLTVTTDKETAFTKMNQHGYMALMFYVQRYYINSKKYVKS